uniref:Uncharacterized protein n=1 Tax=Wuchereria bancrofti TaxID=6293 RepID=A0A1I8EU76_WUCBA
MLLFFLKFFEGLLCITAGLSLLSGLLCITAGLSFVASAVVLHYSFFTDAVSEQKVILDSMFSKQNNYGRADGIVTWNDARIYRQQLCKYYFSNMKFISVKKEENAINLYFPKDVLVFFFFRCL